MITEDDLMKFMDENAPARQQPEDITAAMAIAKWGLSDSGATGYLDRLEKAGKLKKIKGILLDTGKIGNVWRIVGK